MGTLVLNVKDARRASQFWSQALGYAYQDGGYSEDTTPVLLPQSATAIALALDENDRTHFDLHTDSALEQQAEVERLVSLGATRVDWAYPNGARFVVLADPDGHVFCVVNTGRGMPTELRDRAYQIRRSNDWIGPDGACGRGCGRWRPDGDASVGERGRRPDLRRRRRRRALLHQVGALQRP